MVSTPHTMLASRNSDMYSLYRHQLPLGAGAWVSADVTALPPGACDVRSASCVMVPRPQIMDRLQPGITSHILRPRDYRDNIDIERFSRDLDSVIGIVP